MTCEEKTKKNSDKVGKAVYESALEMAKWKEQHMIEKASEWLKDMVCYYLHWVFDGDTYEDEIEVDTEKMIEDFKQAMMEE